MATTKVPYQDTTAMGVYLKSGPAPSGGAVFTLSIKAGESARITFPPTVTIPEGETGVQFDVTWDSAGTTVLEAQLTEYGGAAVTGTVYEAQIECLLIASTIQLLAPSSIQCLVDTTVTLSVVFSSPVDGNQTVTIASDDETIADPQQSSVTVLDTEQTADVLVDLLRVGSANITATHASGSKQSGLTVVPAAYGPSAYEEGPSGESAFELVPVGLSAERID